MAQNQPGGFQAIIEALDRCWQEGHPADTRRFLHPDVAFAGPRFQVLARGVDACVRSYEEFVASVRVHSFEADDYAADLSGEVAVVTYRWKIDYEAGGQRCREVGHELLLFVRHAGEWLIRWRVQQPGSATQP